MSGLSPERREELRGHGYVSAFPHPVRGDFLVDEAGRSLAGSTGAIFCIRGQDGEFEPVRTDDHHFLFINEAGLKLESGQPKKVKLAPGADLGNLLSFDPQPEQLRNLPTPRRGPLKGSHVYAALSSLMPESRGDLEIDRRLRDRLVEGKLAESLGFRNADERNLSQVSQSRLREEYKKTCEKIEECRTELEVTGRRRRRREGNMVFRYKRGLIEREKELDAELDGLLTRNQNLFGQLDHTEKVRWLASGEGLAITQKGVDMLRMLRARLAGGQDAGFDQFKLAAEREESVRNEKMAFLYKVENRVKSAHHMIAALGRPGSEENIVTSYVNDAAIAADLGISLDQHQTVLAAMHEFDPNGLSRSRTPAEIDAQQAIVREIYANLPPAASGKTAHKALKAILIAKIPGVDANQKLASFAAVRGSLEAALNTAGTPGIPADLDRDHLDYLSAKIAAHMRGSSDSNQAQALAANFSYLVDSLVNRYGLPDCKQLYMACGICFDVFAKTSAAFTPTRPLLDNERQTLDYRMQFFVKNIEKFKDHRLIRSGTAAADFFPEAMAVSYHRPNAPENAEFLRDGIQAASRFLRDKNYDYDRATLGLLVQVGDVFSGETRAGLPGWWHPEIVDWLLLDHAHDELSVDPVLLPKPPRPRRNVEVTDAGSLLTPFHIPGPNPNLPVEDYQGRIREIVQANDEFVQRAILERRGP